MDPDPYWIRIQELPGSGSGTKLGQNPGSGSKFTVTVRGAWGDRGLKSCKNLNNLKTALNIDFFGRRVHVEDIKACPALFSGLYNKDSLYFVLCFI